MIITNAAVFHTAKSVYILPYYYVTEKRVRRSFFLKNNAEYSSAIGQEKNNLPGTELPSGLHSGQDRILSILTDHGTVTNAGSLFFIF